MAQNVEIKVWCRDPGGVRGRLEGLGAERKGVLRQRDSYFGARCGRLKLRESESGAELIAYERSDAGSARVSNYTVVPVPDPAALGQALGQALGVRTVVVKARELWLCGATRIHLDRVERLGWFVELETVVGERPLHEAQAEYERVAAALAIDAMEPVSVSYADLLLGEITDGAAGREG